MTANEIRSQYKAELDGIHVVKSTAMARSVSYIPLLNRYIRKNYNYWFFLQVELMSLIY